MLDNGSCIGRYTREFACGCITIACHKILLARLPSAQREAVLGSSGGDGGEKYKSIVVAGRNKSWVNSDACLRIGRELRGPLRYLALLAHIIPRLIRDVVYKFLSGQRKVIWKGSRMSFVG